MKDRLKSFNANNVNIKWASRKVPTKAAMARAFYRFAPTKINNDQVECDICKLKLTNWQNFKGNPISRHSGLNVNCPISKLGTFVCMESESSVPSKSEGEGKSPRISYEEMVNVCRSTFPESIPEELKHKLASEGFVYLQTSSKCNTPLYGCISCNSQDENGALTHKPKCAVSRLMKNLKSIDDEKEKREEKEKKDKDKAKYEAGPIVTNETKQTTKAYGSVTDSTTNKERVSDSLVQKRPDEKCTDRPNFMTMEPFPVPRPKTLNPADVGMELQNHRNEIKLWFDKQLLRCLEHAKEPKTSEMVSSLMKYTLKQTDLSIMKLNNLMTCYYEVKFEKPTSNCTQGKLLCKEYK